MRHAAGFAVGSPGFDGKPSFTSHDIYRFLNLSVALCRRCVGRGWRVGRRGSAALGVFGKTVTEVVEGVFQHASGDIGGLGILVDQQCGGIGFAAGGEAAE